MKVIYIQVLLLLVLTTKLMAGTWTPLDSMPTAQVTEWSAAQPKLCADAQGTVYCAFQDYDNNYKISVLQLHAARWQYVGAAAFSDGQADNICIASSSDGTLFVAYTDQALQGAVVVKKYVGNAWISLGIESMAYRAAQQLNLAVSPQGQAIVAFINQANANKVSVLQYNNISWETIGESSLPSNSLTQLCLAMSKSGTLVMAFNDAAVNNRLSAMTFSNQQWTLLGSRGISAGTAQYTSIAIDANNRPYLACSDNSKPVVYCYDNAKWNNISSSFTAATNATNIALALMNDSIPVLAYTNANSNVQKAAVVCYQNTNWHTMGADGFMPLSVLGSSLVATAAGIYTAFEHSTQSSIWRYQGLQVSVSSTAPNCIDNATGQASALASNGVPPYSYRWSNGRSSQAIDNVLAGRYRVTVGDQLGEQSSAELLITVLDTTKPHIACPSSQSISITDNSYSSIGEALQAKANDNCYLRLSNSLTQTESLNAYQFAIGKHEIIWTATDNSGNTASCTFMLEISKAPQGLLIGGTVHGKSDTISGIAQFIPIGDTSVVAQSTILNQSFSLRAPSAGQYLIKIQPNNAAQYADTYYGNTTIRELALPIRLGTRNIGGLDIELQSPFTALPLQLRNGIHIASHYESPELSIINPQGQRFRYQIYSIDGRTLTQSTTSTETRLDINRSYTTSPCIVLIETDEDVLRYVW